MATPLAETGSRGWAGLLPTALLVALATGALYSVNLGHLPHPDELHHILAARGLIETGEPRIAEGLYTRGLLQTWLVAWSFDAFGVGLAAARVPSVVAIALLNGLFFVWLGREAGRAAAWVGTALWALSPFAIDTALFCRFYALQGLAFFIGCWLAYAAVVRARGLGWRLGLGLAALPFLALAVQLQPTTLLGLVGLGAWAAGALLLPWLGSRAAPARTRLLAVLGLVLGGLLVLAGLHLGGQLAKLWAVYRSTPAFNEDSVGDFWFYHAWYSLLYPSLWPLVGVLGLAAVARWPRPTGFALVVFAVGFLLNSFAASKGLRYIFYTQIFLFVPWALGLVVLWQGLVGFVGGLTRRLGMTLQPLTGRGVAIARLLVAGALLFLVAANPAWLRSTLLLADATVPPEKPRTDWSAARAALRPWLETADVVVTTEELGALYFLGRYDVRFSPSKMGELAPGERHEFGIDPRTGRPVIAENASVERLVACLDKGLVVGPRHHLGMAILVNPALEAFLRGHARRLDLPPASRLYAFGWDHPNGWTPPPDAGCDGLPRFGGPEKRRPVEGEPVDGARLMSRS